MPAIPQSSLRFSTRSIMLVVALAGIVLGVITELERRGHALVDFTAVVRIVDEPLINPVNVIKIEQICTIIEDGSESSRIRITLEDGRVVEVADTLRMTLTESVLDLEASADGAAKVYKIQAHWDCGNPKAREALIRIPLFRRVDYWNYRVLVGRGKVVKPGSSGISVPSRTDAG